MNSLRFHQKYTLRKNDISITYFYLNISSKTPCFFNKKYLRKHLNLHLQFGIKMIVKTKEFWDKKYASNSTGWDIGKPSKPLQEYFEQLEDKNLKILIPGSGNSWEAEFLFINGFKNTHIIDISPLAIQNFKLRVPDFPHTNIFEQDFFEHQHQYDLIIEQTFFCAINPELREKYVLKMHELLKPKGKLVGLFFNTPLNSNHPPFGGSRDEYQELFKDQFHFKTFEIANNSIGPRAGNELFINFCKK